MAKIPLIDETAKCQHNIYNRGDPKCNRIKRQFSTESGELAEITEKDFHAMKYYMYNINRVERGVGQAESAFCAN
jgi:hypothetical protein